MKTVPVINDGPYGFQNLKIKRYYNRWRSGEIIYNRYHYSYIFFYNRNLHEIVQIQTHAEVKFKYFSIFISILYLIIISIFLNISINT